MKEKSCFQEILEKYPFIQITEDYSISVIEEYRIFSLEYETKEKLSKNCVSFIEAQKIADKYLKGEISSFNLSFDAVFMTSSFVSIPFFLAKVKDELGKQDRIYTSNKNLTKIIEKAEFRNDLAYYLDFFIVKERVIDFALNKKDITLNAHKIHGKLKVRTYIPSIHTYYNSFCPSKEIKAIDIILTFNVRFEHIV